MILTRPDWRNGLPAVALSLVPALYLEALHALAGAPISLAGLGARWLFTVAVLLAGSLSQPRPIEGGRWEWPWLGIAIAGAGGGAGIAYVLTGATLAAWVMLAALYAVLLGLDTLATGSPIAWRRWGARAALILAGGVVPVAIAQVEGRFSEEEFSAALEILAVAGYVILLIVAARFGWPGLAARARPGLRFRRGAPAIILIVVSVLGLGNAVRSYQHSFYPAQAPAYPGISAATPFLCGQIPADSQTFDGGEVFQSLLARVEANPLRGVPEVGMLALGTGESQWAEQFHDELLREAGQNLFAGPSNSLKVSQAQAALRVYYYGRVREAFPDLFTAAETQTLAQWFAAINRRALTVEWVDWLYGLAYAKWPEGPYENQESGAGLLAALEYDSLAAPDLSAANQDYLARNPRGWAARFRNTDDAFNYQSDWLRNAYLQSLYTGQSSPDNIRLSFEWQLAQALPNGASPRYNHTGALSWAAVAYLGAGLLNDGRYVWLSAQALNALDASDARVRAQPGVEQAVDLEGRSPTEGSCLVYGDSGLPNQAGPLAPDKLVFRDGWSADSAYALLNLRFAGWHRYKATNSFSQLYQAGPLVVERAGGERSAWLPAGRQLFRDKRLPRENLNGLLIERSGLSAVLYALTGLGGPWAQDPPFYATVERFEPDAEVDVATTLLDDWHGWRHQRTTHFYHGGPIVIVDDAEGPPGQGAALAWHVVGEGEARDGRIALRGGASPAEMVVLSAEAGDLQVQPEAPGSDGPGRTVLYRPANTGGLSVVTVFLAGPWVGARAEILQEPIGPTLLIVQGTTRISLPLSGEGAGSISRQP